MRCNSCGLEPLPDSASYCPRCGKDQRTPIIATHQPNWFERHTSWTMSIAFFLATVIISFMGIWHNTTTPEGRLNESGPWFRYLIGGGLLLWSNAWFLRKKKNSLWHLIWIIPVELIVIYFITLG